MADKARKLFNLRSFVTLTATVTGIGLPISGLANHLHQMDSMLSFSRHAWMATHNTLGVLFLLSIALHAIFNRRMFLNYLRGHAGRSMVGREAVCAVVLVAAVLVFAVGHVFH